MYQLSFEPTHGSEKPNRRFDTDLHKEKLGLIAETDFTGPTRLPDFLEIQYQLGVPLKHQFSSWVTAKS
jgi:hypothetical protein